MWTDIRWKDVAKKFPDSFTPAFLRDVAYRLIRSYQGSKHNWLRDPLMDVVAHTLRQYKIVPRKSYRLKTLTLSSDGTLTPIKYDVKMDFQSIN